MNETDIQKMNENFSLHEESNNLDIKMGQGDIPLIKLTINGLLLKSVYRGRMY